MILGRCTIFHIPKTGGAWVRRALDRSCNVLRVIESHTIHRSLEWDERKKYAAFVRHPLSWYRSYYSYRIINGWNTDDCDEDVWPWTVLDRYRDIDFSTWVNRVVDNRPGYLGKLYADYVKYPLDFVGRQECLVEDLVRFLKLSGEEFDEIKLRTTPATNSSAFHPSWNGCAAARLMDSESDVALKYYGANRTE